MRPFAIAFGFLLLAMGPGGWPAAAADAENGKQIAQRWCAECHLVMAVQARS